MIKVILQVMKLVQILGKKNESYHDDIIMLEFQLLYRNANSITFTIL